MKLYKIVSSLILTYSLVYCQGVLTTITIPSYDISGNIVSSSTNINVPSETIMEIVKLTGRGTVEMQDRTVNSKYHIIGEGEQNLSTAGSLTLAKGHMIAGPAVIKVSAITDSGGRGAVLSYRFISNTGTPVILNSTNSVVIPSDSAGSVNIILESSIDLVTWTAALPGTYGASTQKRFFRIRAVQN